MPAIPTVLIVSLLAWGAGAPAQAPNVVTREATMVVTVDRIERYSRMLIAHSEGRVVHTIYVDPSMKAFDDLEVGDVVTVRYTESVVVQVRPNAKLTDLQDTTEAAHQAGDASVVRQHKRIITIEEIDPQGLFVTYRTHDNLRGVHPVLDKALLKGLKRGDRIEITLTQARAVSIERKR